MELTLRYCPICETETRRDANGDCLNCRWWEQMHLKVGTPVDPYILANTNDGSEYETPVLAIERSR